MNATLKTIELLKDLTDIAPQVDGLKGAVLAVYIDPRREHTVAVQMDREAFVRLKNSFGLATETIMCKHIPCAQEAAMLSGIQVFSFFLKEEEADQREATA